jgi:hypothetical protein
MRLNGASDEDQVAEVNAWNCIWALPGFGASAGVGALPPLLGDNGFRPQPCHVLVKCCQIPKIRRLLPKLVAVFGH